ncbi:MAG TPA: hypothetical protein VMB91_08810 [Solirubrobacteraceae bacterium]|nr:hypothetical protein [Solirubrobacteraceae bacterium]
MASDRSRYGLLVSAAGAVLLAVSVFLPWYELTLTPDGASFAANLAQGLAGQYGNESLQHLISGVHGNLASAGGQQLAALSARQTLHDLNVVLLVLAGIALFDALTTIARAAGPAAVGGGGGGGRMVSLVGVLAAACVAYRMSVPPVPAGGLVALTLREGSWLALLGSLMMVLGPIWPQVSLEGAPGSTLIRA